MRIGGYLYLEGDVAVVLDHYKDERRVRLDFAEPGQPFENGITICVGPIDARALIRELEEAATWVESGHAS